MVREIKRFIEIPEFVAIILALILFIPAMAIYYSLIFYSRVYKKIFGKPPSYLQGLQ